MGISVDKAVIARLTKGGQKFEILVDPEKALAVKGGKEIKSEELLALEEVFEDSKKGERVSPDIINKTFGTNDIEKISRKIVREGDVQLTTDQRHKMVEDKRNAISAIIAREGINPQTKVPHPQDRILRAMDEAKVKIELERRAEEQVDTILQNIQKIIPIKFEKIKIAIKVPSQFAANAAGIIRKYGTPSKEEWKSDGSYMCTLKLSAGMQAELYDKLNSLTHGEVVVKNLD